MNSSGSTIWNISSSGRWVPHKESSRRPTRDAGAATGLKCTLEPDGYDDLDITAVGVVQRSGTEARRVKRTGSPLHAGPGKLERLAGELAARNETGLRPCLKAHNLLRADHSARHCHRSQHRTVPGPPRGAGAAERVLLCSLRPSLRTPHSGFSNIVAAGDEVVVSHNGHSRGIVDAVLPRRSALARPDVFYSHLQQVIVANVDQLLVVASWRDPNFWPELVDRYLLAAVRNNLAPVVCINKVDLAEDPAPLDETARALRRAGYRVILTSAVTGEGLAELRDVLHGKTTALAGLSGVGKSSLLSAAEPGLNLKVGEVNEHQHMGRHTTTQVSLHGLAAGGFVADTPGIRSLAMHGVPDHLQDRRFREFAARCEYANCSHTREPGQHDPQAGAPGRALPDAL